MNFEDTIKQMKGPLQALKTLHDDGYIHRDVTVSNMLIMSRDRGVLGVSELSTPMPLSSVLIPNPT